MFYKQGLVRPGFAHRLMLKDGAVPAIKYHSHDSELQMVSETASVTASSQAATKKTTHWN